MILLIFSYFSFSCPSLLQYRTTNQHNAATTQHLYALIFIFFLVHPFIFTAFPFFYSTTITSKPEVAATTVYKTYRQRVLTPSLDAHVHVDLLSTAPLSHTHTHTLSLSLSPSYFGRHFTLAATISDTPNCNKSPSNQSWWYFREETKILVDRCSAKVSAEREKRKGTRNTRISGQTLTRVLIR